MLNFIKCRKVGICPGFWYNDTRHPASENTAYQNVGYIAVMSGRFSHFQINVVSNILSLSVCTKFQMSS